MLELIGLVAGLLIGAFFLDHPSPVVPLCGRRAAGRPGLRFGRLPGPG